jgi:hypothetical protein
MFIDWKRSSKLLAARLPEFVRADAPMFAAFLAAYYEWLDTQPNPSWGINNFLPETDIDQTEDRFVDSFCDALMIRIPKYVLADRRLLLKHIKQFYRAKGTEQGFRFLFRVLFDVEIDFYYPSRDIWRLDNSEWTVLTSLQITAAPMVNPAGFIGRQIYGTDSSARAGVTNVTTYYNDAGVQVYELYYSKPIGEFEVNDVIADYLTNQPIGTVLTGGVVTYPGTYTTFDGHIEREKKLQDDFFYQDFSYVVRAPIVLGDYQDIVGQLLHPAGTLLFGEFYDYSSYPIPQIGISNSVLGLSLGGPLSMSALTYVAAHLTTSTLPLAPITFLETYLMPSLTYADSFKIDTLGPDIFAIPTTGLLSDIASSPLSLFASWPLDTFTSGKAVIGNGSTAFLSDITVGQVVQVYDRDGVNATQPNVIASIESDETARLMFPYVGSLPHGGFIN